MCDFFFCMSGKESGWLLRVKRTWSEVPMVTVCSGQGFWFEGCVARHFRVQFSLSKGGYVCKRVWHISNNLPEVSGEVVASP